MLIYWLLFAFPAVMALAYPTAIEPQRGSGFCARRVRHFLHLDRRAALRDRR
jgi:hypothetical protein